MNEPITIAFQVDVISILIISGLIVALIFYVNHAIKHADPTEKPKGIVLLASLFVSAISKLTQDNMGKKTAPNYAPYVGVLTIYLLMSNLSGLFGLNPPTANYSVTLTLALITVILIQRMSIRSIGFLGYLKSYFEPNPVFFIMNFFGKLAPLVSMSVRLFGNITSGSIIMLLVYTFTAWVSSLVPVVGAVNFLGPVIAPFLHLYFDLFIGAIQVFIFISLTTVFIGNEVS